MVREEKRVALRRILGGFSLLSASHLQVPGRWWCVLGSGRAGTRIFILPLHSRCASPFRNLPFEGGDLTCVCWGMHGELQLRRELKMMSTGKWLQQARSAAVPPTPPPHGRSALHFRRPDASCAFPPRVAHGRPPSALPVSGSAAAIAESEEGFDRSSRISSQTGTPPRVVLASLQSSVAVRERPCR